MPFLKEIWIYPVKSLGGFRVQQAEVGRKGLRHDRRWMLVDEEGRFLSQREISSLCLLTVRKDGDGWWVDGKGDSIRLEAGKPERPVSATLWDDAVITHEVSAAHNEWFSSQLNMAVRLVHFPEDGVRPTDERYAPGHEVSLADGYPLLVIGEGSLHDLNSRLAAPVEMNRFRPNLVVAETQPFEEDTWNEFTIGTNRFRGVKPCARCMVPTIDPATGVKGKEPIATLARYRSRNGSVFFGQNVVPLDTFVIHEKDPIHLH